MAEVAAGFQRLRNHPAESKTVLFNGSCYLWIHKISALVNDVKLQTLNQVPIYPTQVVWLIYNDRTAQHRCSLRCEGCHL